MLDRRLFIHFYWTVLGIVLLVASIGLLNLYSATSYEGTGMPLYTKQFLWMIIGMTLMAVVALVDYRVYADFAYMAYTVAVILLLGVLAYGMITSGAQRWVRIGSLSFQPSEFVKISFIVVLAKYFQRTSGREGYSLKHLA